MPIDLTAKSQELKDFVSQYETPMFLGDLTSLMCFIRFDQPIRTLQGLSSPQRQLLYLAGLNLTSPIPASDRIKRKYTDDEFEHIKTLLNEIEEGYSQFFYPKPTDVVDDEWHKKRMIAMPTFLGYFNQGLLNYEEQIIERTREYFEAFNTEIKAHFGLDIADFIEMYNYVDSVPNKFLMENVNKKEGRQTWKEFCEEMKLKNIMPWEMQDHLPEHFRNFFEFMDDKGKMNRFSMQYLADKFGNEKAQTFLKTLTCERSETNFLYYTQKNIVYSKPIFKVNDSEYQSIETNQIIQAIYNTLFDFCKTTDADKLYSIRGVKLENKVENIFKRFFKNNGFLYKGYYTQDGHEQDLLFLNEGVAFIIEAKASKRDEPLREPDRSYPLILENFDETIQKGYDQTYRVKSKFINKLPLKIFRDQQLRNEITEIRTKNYFKAFSIIVTLERFGQIQTDLTDLLEIYEDDDFPWSVCIDDLEVFLLLLEKQGKKKPDLVNFLTIREKLHGRLFIADELEACGAFVSGKVTLKEANDPDNIFPPNPALTDIFDDTYQSKGLGFDNEKNLELKTSGKFIPIGSIKLPLHSK